MVRRLGIRFSMLDSDTGKKTIKKWYNNEKLVKVVALAKQPSVKRGEGGV
jgi:hypothetical protein